MHAFLRGQWFLIGLAIALGIGFGFSVELTPLWRSVSSGPIVFVVLLLMSFPMESRAMWRAVRAPMPVLLATTVSYILVPATAWGLGHLLRDDLANGLMIAACIPCTLASAAVWTRRAGGNDAVAIMVTMLTNLACFLVTPRLLQLTTGQDVQLNVSDMFKNLAIVVALPITIGQALRMFSVPAQWATRHKFKLGIAAQLGILSIVLLGSIHAGNTIREHAALANASANHASDVKNRTDAKNASDKNIAGAKKLDAPPAGSNALDTPVAPVTLADWGLMIAVVLTVHTGMLFCGFFLGRMLGIEYVDRVAVAFSGSQKTLAVGIFLATKYYTGLALLPMIVYHVGQLFIDTWIADGMKRRAAAVPVSVAQPAPATVEATR